MPCAGDIGAACGGGGGGGTATGAGEVAGATGGAMETGGATETGGGAGAGGGALLPDPVSAVDCAGAAHTFCEQICAPGQSVSLLHVVCAGAVQTPASHTRPALQSLSAVHPSADARRGATIKTIVARRR